MGDGARFDEKWDFRRQENNYDDSSSDDPDTNDSLIHIPNLVLDSNIPETKTLTREQQPVKTRKRRNKKDENKPKQARRRKPKTVCVEENEAKVMEKDDVGIFMKTLLDELTASRESLMDWVKTELYGSYQNVAPPTKRAAAAATAHRSVKKRRTKKKVEEEKQGKPDENGQEMNKPKEMNSEIGQNGGDQVQELDCNAGPLDRFLNSGHGNLGRNYFQQQRILPQAEMENATVTNQKSVVLAIQAPNLSQRQKKTREANTIKNISSTEKRTVSETQKDGNFAQKLSSTPSLQSFPVTSSLNSLFPSSSQGITSFTSNNNFHLGQQQPVVTQIPDLSELQTGFTGGQGFGNSMFHNNSYFSGFPAAFQPNLIAGSYNFPAQVNPTTSIQQRDNNNILGGLRMTGGAIRYSGNRNTNSSLSDYITGSGR